MTARLRVMAAWSGDPDAEEGSGTDQEARETAAFCAQILATGIAVATGAPDAVRAIAAADSIPVNEPAAQWLVASANLMLARLAERQGEHRRAMRIAARIVPAVPYPQFHASMLAVEARSAAALGQDDVARRAARRYLALRSDPEPAVLDSIAEELEEMRRLVAEAR